MEQELKDEERTRCEVWTRVMGYHRPVSSWNAGKQSEHAERKYFSEPDFRPSPERVAAVNQYVADLVEPKANAE